MGYILSEEGTYTRVNRSIGKDTWAKIEAYIKKTAFDANDNIK